MRPPIEEWTERRIHPHSVQVRLTILREWVQELEAAVKGWAKDLPRRSDAYINLVQLAKTIPKREEE